MTQAEPAPGRMVTGRVHDALVRLLVTIPGLGAPTATWSDDDAAVRERLAMTVTVPGWSPTMHRMELEFAFDLARTREGTPPAGDRHAPVLDAMQPGDLRAALEEGLSPLLAGQRTISAAAARFGYDMPVPLPSDPQHLADDHLRICPVLLHALVHERGGLDGIITLRARVITALRTSKHDGRAAISVDTGTPDREPIRAWLDAKGRPVISFAQDLNMAGGGALVTIAGGVAILHGPFPETVLAALLENAVGRSLGDIASTGITACDHAAVISATLDEHPGMSDLVRLGFDHGTVRIGDFTHG